jgi:hypothetical protein
LPEALHSKHTKLISSRFSEGRLARPPFEILYLAENPMVALFEVEALLGSPTMPGDVVAQPTRPWVVVNASVRLQRIVDLTDVPVAQTSLQTSAQELTGDWRGYQQRSSDTSVELPVGAAPTQALGGALRGVSPQLEGFISLSAKLPYLKILGVFPEHLLPGSLVQFQYIDPTGARQSHSIESRRPQSPPPSVS